MPPLLKLEIVETVKISDSKSVAVNFKDDSSTSNNTLESIGRVCLFSTTPSVVLRELTISSFAMKKSILIGKRPMKVSIIFFMRWAFFSQL